MKMACLILSLLAATSAFAKPSCYLDKSDPRECGSLGCLADPVPGSETEAVSDSYNDNVHWENSEFSYSASFSKRVASVDLLLIDKRTGSKSWTRINTENDSSLILMTQKIGDPIQYYLRFKK